MKITAIYDNDGESIDRYTVVTDVIEKQFEDGQKTFMMLGLSEGGDAVSMWGEGYDGDHLGKRVRFENLSEATQKHIARRVFL